jgi:hypothetical protein
MRTKWQMGVSVSIELRPLRLGEILDRMFRLYRERFLLFLGIAAVTTLLELIWSVGQLWLTSHANQTHIDPKQQVITTVTIIAGWAFSFGTAALATAAINRAVLAIYEGRQVGITTAYGELRGHWFTCVLVNVLGFFIAWSPMIVVALGAVVTALVARSAKTLSVANPVAFIFGFAGFAAFIVIPLCLWLTLRYSLAIPACIQEGISTFRSLKRSVILSRGSRGRIFVLFLVVGTAWMIPLTALMIPTFFFFVRSKGQATLGATLYTLGVSFLCNTLMKPVYGIGLTLLYFDERIRKEGYDVEWMLEHSTQPETVVSPEILPGPDPSPTGMITG